MAQTRTSIAVSLTAILLSTAVAIPAFASERRPSSKPAAKAPAGPVVEVVEPPKPLTLEQQPATPPRVTFQAGQLSITAHNSTLGDILRSVHAQTGAVVDVPANATERVVGQFGPGPARDVLADLLNGSHFNYVMLGSAAHPDSLARVILTPRVGGPIQPTTAQFTPPPAPAPVEPEEAADPNDDFSDDQLADQPGDEIQPDQNQDASQQQDQTQQPGLNNGQGGIRTPEQLLRELQQRQLLLQQQGINPQGRPGFPLPAGQQPPPQPQPPQ
jgi:hypothetical protein